MKILFAILIISFLTISCGNNEPFDADTERLKLIDKRDNNMDLVNEMLDLRRRVVTKAGNFNALSESDREMINELAKEMTEANTAMVQWINNFNRNIDKYMDMENGAPEQKEWMGKMDDELEDAIEGIEDVIENGRKTLSKL